MRERKTLVVEEVLRSRTTFDMVCIPCKTNSLGIFSLMHRLESHMAIKVFLGSVRPTMEKIRQIKIKSWTNMMLQEELFFDILDDLFGIGKCFVSIFPKTNFLCVA